ncbi:SPX domain-containing protein 1 [Musa troglodytarum]|uniref:SPX domain-containing protein 1 n=1 Tax=Musa troglodytarum TaxID=320322 RepID=A0A9E7L678_9LILI|nr:SPX domain-containing protein 1 [Musa troglodytarum]
MVNDEDFISNSRNGTISRFRASLPQPSWRHPQSRYIIESNAKRRHRSRGNKTRDMLFPPRIFPDSVPGIFRFPSFPVSHSSSLSFLRPSSSSCIAACLFPTLDFDRRKVWYLEMKFGKSLGNQIEDTLPEWRDKFLSYKDLKKRLKLISGGGGERLAKRPKVADDVGPGDRDPSSAPESAATPVVEEEEDFMRLLEAELDKFNTFFVEKEEEYIIRQKDLQDRVVEAISKDSKEELMKARKEIVDLHGEIVLLENYSALNYTGTLPKSHPCQSICHVACYDYTLFDSKTALFRLTLIIFDGNPRKTLDHFCFVFFH